jgi:hypothetical protein
VVRQKPSDEARLLRRLGFFHVLECACMDNADACKLSAGRPVCRGGFPAWARSALFLEVLGIDAREVAPLRRYRALLEDGVHRAGWLAGAAVNTFVRIDEILLVFLAGVNAIHGADIHAGCVLHADAGLTDYVGHLPMDPSLQERDATPSPARSLAISYRLRRCLSRLASITRKASRSRTTLSRIHCIFPTLLVATEAHARASQYRGGEHRTDSRPFRARILPNRAGRRQG